MRREGRAYLSRNKVERERQEGNERKRVLHPLYAPSNRFGSPGPYPGLNRTGLSQPRSTLQSTPCLCSFLSPVPFYLFSAPLLITTAPLPCCNFYFFCAFFFFVSIAFLLLFSCIFIHLNLLFCSHYSLYIYFSILVI